MQKIASNHLAMAARLRYLATMNEKSTLERALELARQSNCRTVEEIRRSLKSEGYSNIEQHLVGASIKKKLNAAILARSTAGDAAGA